MKYYNQYKKALFAGVILLTVLSGCNKESSSDPTNPQRRIDLLKSSETATDKWITANYTEPHNIQPLWHWQDPEASYGYNLVPPHEESVVPTLVIIKHAFLNAYKEYMGLDFINTYVPRQLLLIGSYAYNGNDGTIVLGQAEGGLKIVFYGVDDWNNDTNKMRFIHTMHHEFAHILHQTKLYTEEFEKVTPGGYTSNWYNDTDKEAYEQGFVSKYARLSKDEDFVETLSYYLTKTPEQWEEMLAGIDGSVAGDAAKTAAEGEGKTKEDAEAIGKAVATETANQARASITKKLNYVKDYLKTQWNYDLDEFRVIVNKRMAEVMSDWDKVMESEAPEFVTKKEGDKDNPTESAYRSVDMFTKAGCSYCQSHK